MGAVLPGTSRAADCGNLVHCYAAEVIDSPLDGLQQCPAFFAKLYGLLPVRRRENLEEHVVDVGEGLDVDPAAVSAESGFAQAGDEPQCGPVILAHVYTKSGVRLGVDRDGADDPPWPRRWSRPTSQWNPVEPEPVPRDQPGAHRTQAEIAAEKTDREAMVRKHLARLAAGEKCERPGLLTRSCSTPKVPRTDEVVGSSEAC
jgi:hypothetical protein